MCQVTITPVQGVIYVFEVYLSFIQPGWYLNFNTLFMKNVSIIWTDKDEIIK